jgi:hypothetical protein
MLQMQAHNSSGVIQLCHTSCVSRTPLISCEPFTDIRSADFVQWRNTQGLPDQRCVPTSVFNVRYLNQTQSKPGWTPTPRTVCPPSNSKLISRG